MGGAAAGAEGAGLESGELEGQRDGDERREGDGGELGRWGDLVERSGGGKRCGGDCLLKNPKQKKIFFEIRCLSVSLEKNLT